MAEDAYSHLNWRPALKIISFTISSSRESDIICFCICVLVQAISEECKVESRVENQQDSIHPLCIPFAKIGRMRETLTEHKKKPQWKCSAFSRLDIIYAQIWQQKKQEHTG